MKLITVTILILLVGVEHGSCWVKMNGPPLVTNEHRFCRPTSNTVKKATIRPCYDAPGCRLPECCGIIGNVNSVFEVTYVAQAPIQKSGEFRAQMDGKKLAGTFTRMNQQHYILSFQPVQAHFNRNVCESSSCPQVPGNTYTMKLPFKFASPPGQKMTEVYDFIFDVQNELDQPVYCASLRARIISEVHLRKIPRGIVEETRYTAVEYWK